MSAGADLVTATETFATDFVAANSGLTNEARAKLRGLIARRLCAAGVSALVGDPVVVKIGKQALASASGTRTEPDASTFSSAVTAIVP